MKLLVVAATEKEIEALEKTRYQNNHGLDVDFLITGVGMTATAYALTKKLVRQKYDLVVNIGLAGTFREEIKIGEVVNVITDCFADLGVEDGEKFLTLTQIGLMDEDKFPFWNGKLKSDNAERFVSLHMLKNVKAITVNKVHGKEESIHRVVQKFHPDIESMEGAACFYVCMMEKTPCIQLRSISNRIERRNRDNWDIHLSMQNLNDVIFQFFREIQEMNPSLKAGI